MSNSEDQLDLSANKEINTIYGDMITFIMCLFILLFVLSQNKQSDQTFFTQMRIKFGAKQIQQKEVITTEELFVSQLEGYIKKEKLSDQAKILVDEFKITLILPSPTLFASGKAALNPSTKKSLSSLAKILKQVKNPIIVEGHTDSVPIKTDAFESNWELSFHRAYSVIKYLVTTHGFSPKYLSAVGYGEHKPIADNNTLEGRAQNRRIAVTIIRVSRSDAQP